MTTSIKHIFATIAAVSIILTAEVATSSPLIVTHSSSMPPLAFINNKGKPDGVLIDLWKEWSEQSGTEIKFRLQPWKTAVQDTISGKASINGGMFYSKSRAEKMLYGDYIFHFKGGLFAARNINEKTILNGGESCGVIKEGYAKIFMEHHHPYTPLMLFDSAHAMYTAAAEGRLKIFVADCPVALYQMNKFGITDLFKNVQELYTRELYPTVSKNNPGLVKLINKNMAAIPPERKRTIINKWLDLPDREQNHHKTADITVTLVLLLMSYLYRNEIKAVLNAFKNKITKQT
ncbi:transporter substrate-binding domain-containing protein [Desulfovibrio sp. JC022]|uniref:transporter substrate-binding domain-containing protein n=1 Tax=Desulfovibrio sp. JC022 TaxID=2593642 RepID=UPI0013D6CE75|nr:transporter substrate-binding domain-containing protein [Desulfovibrio sp. JC022]NDV21589.1 transporter substrate-binding domain-containing protein [Desulfovibrio sp. JC022]